MAVEGKPEVPATNTPAAGGRYLQKFWLYESQSKFYMIGRDKTKTLWRVLEIDRLENSELNIREDSTTYSERECADLLKRIHEGNKSSGGLNLVTTFYGIVGFVKFLGPYYMLIITERREIGAIFGHLVYAISKIDMVELTNPNVKSPVINSKDENRYKKLLCTVDLTKDFFFSYSYHIMRSVQKNVREGESGQVLYEKMFVWNEFLTRGVRNLLKNTMWTVALVYGFFKQASISVSGKDFNLTLIARRSRHFAGTRYLKRGVNDKGRVANDVETEQIVFEDINGGIPPEIASVVQNRGSIPLFWSQESSFLNLKPDIILHKQNNNYEATRLHFENLVMRYGKPIIVLNLIKSRERKPRESILRAEFANAIDAINKDLADEDHLKFMHWDLNQHTRKSKSVLTLLGKMTENALNLTGFFYCQLSPGLGLDGVLPDLVKEKQVNSNDGFEKIELHGVTIPTNGDQDEDGLNNRSFFMCGTLRKNDGFVNVAFAKPPVFQKGVLRTNCIDCLDRTNVAQYAYGLVALGRQLHALGILDCAKIEIDDPLADELMNLYETMGDTLSLQYGGSAAHNKVFSDRRGQCKAATQCQEFIRTLQRYCNNAYMDAEKQDAINVFLGYFQPQIGKPALWELGSDQHYSIGRAGHTFSFENTRPCFMRSFSDGSILSKSHTPLSSSTRVRKNLLKSVFAETMEEDDRGLLDSPEISTCGCEVSYSRHVPTNATKQLFMERDHTYFKEPAEESTWSNFLDLDSLSSSGNSCEEAMSERSALTNSLYGNLSNEAFANGLTPQTTPPFSEYGSNIKDCETTPEFSDKFTSWVIHGEALFY